jgi:hypothetical protein
MPFAFYPLTFRVSTYRHYLLLHPYRGVTDLVSFDCMSRRIETTAEVDM